MAPLLVPRCTKSIQIRQPQKNTIHKIYTVSSENMVHGAGIIRTQVGLFRNTRTSGVVRMTRDTCSEIASFNGGASLVGFLR